METAVVKHLFIHQDISKSVQKVVWQSLGLYVVVVAVAGYLCVLDGEHIMREKNK